jgi:1-pyrroline-5-carboxylate dehydrogenase
VQEKSILNYIEIGKKEGKLLHGGNKLDRPGFFIEPTIIIDVESNGSYFAGRNLRPVLAVIKARDFDNALEIANNTIYGLTGAVYSMNREKTQTAQPVNSTSAISI